MQTFLPYPDFTASVAALDSKRLGKQRIEALQVLRALTRETYGWKRHPAVRMWVGHAEGVAAYGVASCLEWAVRGGADTVAGTIAVDLAAAGLPSVPRTQEELARDGALPDWIGDERVHTSHRAALVRKDPGFYGALFPGVDPELPYFWPVPA
ncbi:MAG TPA: MSMEG_6728 family protein [Pseudonocardia sp.]